MLILVVSMVLLGLWQLRRLDEKQALNDQMTSRADEPLVTVTPLIAGDPDAAEFRKVSAEGSYLPGADIRVTNRSVDGSAGDWIVSILELDDGEMIAVNRGFIPRRQIADIETYATPSGDIEMLGYLQKSIPGAVQGVPEEILSGAPPEINRLDIELVEELSGVDLAAMWIQIDSSNSSGEQDPLPVPLPDPGEGNHMAYAVQWFLFTAIAVGGYPLVLRRIARSDQRRGDTAPDLG
ncbi:MAG: SURF1 family protein [Acidobacteria bacterium]|nr:SURF1 family protein [Acidobacteriota bacterium]